MSCIVVQSFQMIRHTENRTPVAVGVHGQISLTYHLFLLHDRYSPGIGDPAIASQLSIQSTKCSKILVEFQIFQIRVF